MIPNTKNIHINFTTDEGTNYTGEFSIKRLSVLDQIRKESRRTDLNGGKHYDSPGVGVPASLDQFNGMIAHLELAITSAPKWWDFEKLTDVDVIKKVFEEVISFESSFRPKRKEENGADGASSGQGDSGTQSQKLAVTVASEALLDEEV